MVNFVFILINVFFESSEAFAQTLISYNVPGCNFRSGVINANCVPQYIAFLIGQIFMLTGALSLIMIMWGGIEYTLDKLIGGKEKGITRIKHGILGMVVSGLAFFIVNFAVGALKG